MRDYLTFGPQTANIAFADVEGMELAARPEDLDDLSLRPSGSVWIRSNITGMYVPFTSNELRKLASVSREVTAELSGPEPSLGRTFV